MLLGEARNRKRTEIVSGIKYGKKDKQNKTIAQNSKAETLYRASIKSKKILNQKETKYVPIHQRASDLVKQRQSKLAKLQKQREIANLVK